MVPSATTTFGVLGATRVVDALAYERQHPDQQPGSQPARATTPELGRRVEELLRCIGLCALFNDFRIRRGTHIHGVW